VRLAAIEMLFRAIVVSIHIALIASLLWMGGRGAAMLITSPPKGAAAQALPFAVFITALALLAAILVIAGVVIWLRTRRCRLLVLADLSSWVAAGVFLVPFIFMDFADVIAYGAATFGLLILTIDTIAGRIKMRNARRAAESLDRLSA
jgi:uncharacterized SAM-binding protein YcdF (DUF218 family)